MAKEEEIKKGEVVIDAPKVLKESAEKSRIIKRTDRMTLEVLRDTKYYTKGQIITPHPVLGEELVKNKVAKEV